MELVVDAEFLESIVEAHWTVEWKLEEAVETVTLLMEEEKYGIEAREVAPKTFPKLISGAKLPKLHTFSPDLKMARFGESRFCE